MTIQKIDYLNIKGVEIPLEEYSNKEVFERDFSVVLTDSGIYYWDWLSPEHTRNVPYEEITGIYFKTTGTYPFGFLDIFDNTGRHRLSGPDEKLKNSVIKGVTGAKKKTEHNNNRQQYTEDRILDIEKTIENKTILRDGTYCLSAGIIAEILKKRDKEVHPIGNKTILHPRYENPLFATDHLVIGLDADGELKTIPTEDIALYVCKENVPGNGSGRMTALTIYTPHITDDGNKPMRNHSTFNNLDTKKVIELMTGKI